MCKLVEERGTNDIEYERQVGGLDDEVEQAQLFTLCMNTHCHENPREECGSLCRIVWVFKDGGWFEVVVLFFLACDGSYTCKRTCGCVVSQCAHCV